MNNLLLIDAETLRSLYCDECLTQREIGGRYNVSRTAIKTLMRKYGIGAKKNGERRKIHIDPNRIKELYSSGLSTVKIAAIFGCGYGVICRRMGEFNIPRRKPTEQPHRHGHKINIDKDKLKELYVDKQLTSIEVATELGSAKATVQKRLKEYGLMRTPAEAFAISEMKGRRKRSSPEPGKSIRGPRGYVLIKCPGHHKANNHNYVYEHVLVWEEYHHKKLPKGYIIHHLNGAKNDNRGENLAAMPRKKHAKIHHDEPYKKRIRQLEIENRQLRRALEDSQMIFYLSEN